MSVRDTSCCGLGEINGLQSMSPEAIVQQVQNSFRDRAFYILTGARAHGFKCGRDFCRFIEANKLGTVRETQARRNPNSGNNLRVYIWAVNLRNLAKWRPGKK